MFAGYLWSGVELLWLPMGESVIPSMNLFSEMTDFPDLLTACGKFSGVWMRFFKWDRVNGLVEVFDRDELGRDEYWLISSWSFWRTVDSCSGGINCRTNFHNSVFSNIRASMPNFDEVVLETDFTSIESMALTFRDFGFRMISAVAREEVELF